MAYLAIPDFKFGMDRRRKRVSGVPGTLWTLKNAHISRGGDIERAKRFVPKHTLPEGTFGLAKLGKQLYVFSTDADLLDFMPDEVNLQYLMPPVLTPNIKVVKVLDVKIFANTFYTIAEFDDGNIYHYYGSTLVSDWVTLAKDNSSRNTLAFYLEEKLNSSDVVNAVVSTVTDSVAIILLEARVPGVGFTLGASVVDGGADATQDVSTSTVVANQPEVAEVRATATVTITGGSASPGVNQVQQIKVGAVNLLQVAVDWTGSNEATASAVAVEINNRALTHGFTAVAVDDVITIKAAPGTGNTLNGQAITVTVAGDVTATNSGTISGGVSYTAPVAQVSAVTLTGAYEAEDTWTITLDGVEYKATGTASGMGTKAFVSKARVWSVANTLLCGCKLNDPSNWTDATAATGAVQINVSNQSEGTDRLIALESYQNLLAVFSRSEIRLYQLDEDAQLITFQQSLSNTGTLGRHAAVGYGNNDVYYFDQTGIRSIRPRDAVNAPFVSDIGTALDTFVRAHLRSLPRASISDAVAVIEPVDGRLWLAVGERIYVLSYFPSSKITAWSYYEPPEPLTAFTRVEDRLYARGGDTIYLYGGDSGEEYPGDDEQNVEVELPFLTAEKPAHQKTLKGYDTALDNEWKVDLLFDPNDETKMVEVGRINRHTFHLPNIGLPVHTSTFAFKLTCSRAGAATLSALTCHFDPEEPAA